MEERSAQALHDLGDKCIQADRSTAAAEKSVIEAYYDEGEYLTQFKHNLKEAGVKRQFENLCEAMGINRTAENAPAGLQVSVVQRRANSLR